MLCIAFCLVSEANAQYYGGNWRGRYWGGGGYHASTAAEGYGRGMADVIRAQGEANAKNAEAASTLEDARTKNIDNRLKATEAFYERRRIRNEYKSAERAQRRYTVSRRSELAPLQPQEVDPTTGSIDWPELLTAPEYTEYRGIFDQIFAQRAASGIVSNDDYVLAVNTSKAWRQLLTEKRDDYVFNNLRAAIRFIRRLENDLSL
jgi:hypothetical protein